MFAFDEFPCNFCDLFMELASSELAAGCARLPKQNCPGPDQETTLPSVHKLWGENYLRRERQVSHWLPHPGCLSQVGFLMMATIMMTTMMTTTVMMVMVVVMVNLIIMILTSNEGGESDSFDRGCEDYNT